MGVDLTKNFYFSYTYSLAATLQCNCLAMSSSSAAHQSDGTDTANLLGGPTSAAASGAGVEPLVAGGSGSGGDHPPTPSPSRSPRLAPAAAPPPPPVDWSSMFVWNSFLTRTLREALGGDQWVLPLVHGYFEQRVCSGEEVVWEEGLKGVGGAERCGRGSSVCVR